MMPAMKRTSRFRHVNHLTIEGNVFDHNGWNEDVSSACATMYNHNMYLNANGLVIRDNIIARASSMGIKMRSDSTGDADDLVFENNLFVDGEIGSAIHLVPWRPMPGPLASPRPWRLSSRSPGSSRGSRGVRT